MENKLNPSELKVMEVLWRGGEQPARQIAETLTGQLGWNANTTYTLIKRCIKKGAVERTEPHFMCRALVGKEAVQASETAELVDKLYDGSVDKLFAALLSPGKLDSEQIANLRRLVDELE